MKNLCCSVFFLISLTAFSQADTVFIKHRDYSVESKLVYMTDTLVRKSWMDSRNIICGTSIIPGHYMECAVYGIGLDKVTRTECSGSVVEFVPDKITGIIKTDSTLAVEIKVTDNCCFSFLCNAEVKNDTILNLIYYGYGGSCACSCCFGLKYDFAKEKQLAEKDMKSIKVVMLNGNKRTIKPIKWSKK